MRFAFLWGLLMAATVSQFSGPVTFLVFPDTHFRGALTRTLPDSSNTTTATEADPVFVVTPGTGNLGTPAGGRGAEPTVTGTATAGLDSVLAITQGGRADATARYKVTDSSSNAYGQTPIYIPTGFETVKAVASGDGYQNPRGVVMPDGDLVVVAERWTGTQGLTVYQRAQGVADWTSVVDPIWTTSTAFSSSVRPSPQIWGMPADTTSGMALFVASLEVTATNVQTLRVDVSEDGGTNWRTAGRSNLRFDTTSIKYQLEDALWDDRGRQAVIVVRKYDGGGPTYTLLTYTSNDFGATWKQITSSLISDVRIARTVYQCGVQYLAYIDGSNDLWIRRRTAAGGAWALLNSATALDTGAMKESSLGITILPNNQLFVYYRSSAAEPATVIIASSDGGYTWGQPATSTNGSPYYNYPFSGGAGVQYASDESGATLTNGIAFTDLLYYGGTVYMLGNLASTDTVDKSLAILRWGDYSTIEWLDMYRFGKTYYPTQIPSTKDSTITFSGASAEVVTFDASDRLVDRLNASAANVAGYNSLTNVATTNAVHTIVGNGTTAGSLATADLVVRVSATDTTTNYVKAEVRINVTGLQMQVYDVNAGALVGSPAAFTNGAPYEIFVAISYTDLKVSAWWKPVTSDTWQSIASGVTVAPAAGVVGEILFGKVAASVSIMDIMFFRRMGEDGWADGSNTLIGIPAMSLPDGAPGAMNVQWKGGPFYAANAWQVQARGARPLDLANPYALNISPSDQWIGLDDTGIGGTDHRLVFDFGSSHSGAIDPQLAGLVWANMPGVSIATISRWTGAAWSTLKTITLARSPFGAAGSVGFSRTSVSSYLLKPNGTNGIPIALGEGDYNGWWCHVQDAGGDSFAGKILRSTPGQFTTSSGALQATLEFDPSTVVDVNGGGFASVATAETAGTITLYPPDGLAITASSTETTRYWAITMTTAPGYLKPRAGALWFGPAFAMARAVRDGGSIRVATADEMRAVGGSGAMSLQRTVRKARRAVDLPYDQILHQTGYNAIGTEVGTLAFPGGSTARANIDNNLVLLKSLIESRGRATPCALVVDGQVTADPGTTTQVFTGKNFVYGLMADSADFTVGRGSFLYPDTTSGGNQQGSSLTFVEVI